MADLATLGIAIDASQVTPAATKLDSLTTAGSKAEKAISATTISAKALSDALAKTNGDLQKATAMCLADADAQNTLANATKATTAATVDGAAKTVAAHAAVAGSSVKVRESLVLLREASRGNFTRLAGSASILANAFGLLTPEILAGAAAVALIVAPLAALAIAMERGSEEAAKLNNAIAITNNYAGVTTTSVENMAKRISASSGASIGDVDKNIDALVASGKFSASTIELMVSSAERFSQFTGQSADEIVKSYEDMKGGVTKFAVAHEETYHDLTLAQIDYINNLEKQGDHEKAENQLMQDIHDSIYSKTVPAYGYLETALHGVETAASNMWDALLGLGKPETSQQKIQDAIKAISDAQNRINNPQAGLFVDKDVDKAQATAALPGLYTNLRNAMSSGQAEKDKAASDAAKAQANDNAVRKKYDNEGKGPKQNNSQYDNAIGTLQQLKDETQAQIAYNAALADGSKTVAEVARQESIDNSVKSLVVKYNADVAKGTANSKAEASKLLPVINALKIAYGQAYDEKVSTAILKANAAQEQQNDILEKQISLAGQDNDTRTIQIAQYKEIAKLKAQGADLNSPEAKQAVALAGQGAQLGLTNSRVALKNTNVDAGASLGTNAAKATLASDPQNYIKQQQAAYAEIDKLRQADVLSEQQASQAKGQVDQDILTQRLSAATTFFGNLTSLSSSKNAELAAIGKAAAISQATIDGVLAVQKALAAYPPPINFIEAAAVGVSAAVNVAKIAGLANGGTVLGNGGNRSDGVMTRLSPGEEVINAQAAGNNRPLLKAINSGQKVAGSNVSVVIEDHGTPKTYTQTQGTSADEVRMIAEDRINALTPKLMAQETSKRNSPFRVALGQHTKTQPKVSA